MIAWFIITTASVLACLGIYQLMKDRDAKPSNKVYPLSDDDMALWQHAFGDEALKISELRCTREASTKLYELFTSPSIFWEYRKQKIVKNLKDRSAHSRERTHQPSTGAALR